MQRQDRQTEFSVRITWIFFLATRFSSLFQFFSNFSPHYVKMLIKIDFSSWLKVTFNRVNIKNELNSLKMFFVLLFCTLSFYIVLCQRVIQLLESKCGCCFLQGSSQPLLSHVALAVASKLTSALFSAARYVSLKFHQSAEEFLKSHGEESRSFCAIFGFPCCGSSFRKSFCFSYVDSF